MSNPEKPNKIIINLEDLVDEAIGNQGRIIIDPFSAEDVSDNTADVKSEHDPESEQEVEKSDKIIIEGHDLSHTDEMSAVFTAGYHENTSNGQFQICSNKNDSQHTSSFHTSCRQGQSRSTFWKEPRQKRRGKFLVALIPVSVLFCATLVALVLFQGLEFPLFKGGKQSISAEVNSDNEDLVLRLDDGTSIRVPAGSLPVGAKVYLDKMQSNQEIALPSDFSQAVQLYNIRADQPLNEPVTLQILIPAIDEQSIYILVRYDEESWEPVSFTREGDYAIVITDSLSIWGWLDLRTEQFASWFDKSLMTYANADHYIKPVTGWFTDFTGISKYLDIPIEENTEGILLDVSKSGELFSASASISDRNLVRIRVKNNCQFYLHLTFEGEEKVNPRRGGYVDASIVYNLSKMAHSTSATNLIQATTMIDDLVSELMPADVLLLPGDTAEFYSNYKPGTTIAINGKLSSIASLFTSIDPLIALIPIVDIELIAALKDLMGESSLYSRSLTDVDICLTERVLNLSGIRDALYRGGVFAGEKILKSMASLLILPKIVEIRSDYFEGSAIDILEKGSVAKQGGTILIKFEGESEANADELLVVDVIPEKTSGRFMISSGEAHGLALLEDGSLLSWGLNNSGQLGYDGPAGTMADRSPKPVTVLDLNNLYSVDAGRFHSIAVTNDGKVWAWGSNDKGQLGDGTTVNRHIPVLVSGLDQITRVSGGNMHTMAIDYNGILWAWGDNGWGQLGDGSRLDRLTPIKISGLSNITAISAGGAFSVALSSNGTVWSWGANNSGQVGNGIISISPISTPHRISNITDITAISAGKSHALALKSDGTVWTWGDNQFGQLGDGSKRNQSKPVRVSGLSGIVAISAGEYHSYALKSDGTVWAWGSNSNSQLGDGTKIQRNSPVLVNELNEIVAIIAGSYHGHALKADGTIWAWGSNAQGRFGDGTESNRNGVVQVVLD